MDAAPAAAAAASAAAIGAKQLSPLKLAPAAPICVIDGGTLWTVRRQIDADKDDSSVKIYLSTRPRVCLSISIAYRRGVHSMFRGMGHKMGLHRAK